MTTEAAGPATGRTDRIRRLVLLCALVLALVLLGLDRSAAWLYRPAEDAIGVVIYTTAWCGYCAALRAHLDAHGIPYTDRDVETSVAGSMGFWALRGRGVPVSAIGPEVIHGFNLAGINRALTALGYRVPGEAATGVQGTPDREP